MEVYEFETESFPARTLGQKKGLSLNGVKVSGTGPAVEALFFGVADIVDPLTKRRIDAAFHLFMWDSAGVEIANIPFIASWGYDDDSHYTEIFAEGLSAGHQIAVVSESVEPGTPSRKTIRLHVQLVD